MDSGGRGLLVRVGVASAVAGSAGLTLVFSLSAWMLIGGEPTDADARAQAPGVSVFGTIHPQLLNYGSTALKTTGPSAPPVRLASLTPSTFASRFGPMAKDNVDAPANTGSLPASSFEERFAFRQPAPRTRSLQPSVSFADRFGGATPAAAPSNTFALASVSPTLTPATVTPAAPRAAARALVARVAPKTPDKVEKPAGSYRVASLGETPIRTAYASVDTASRDSAIDDSLLKKMTPRDAAPKDKDSKDSTPKDGPLAGVDLTRTAVYDIAARMVYLPNGQRLEAHSGLAEHMDEIRSVNLRSLGPTPPGLYNLTMRESRFHGIEAIRLNPIDETKMYGRAGILAHPYMLGPNGQSNGCVSLKDYPEFLAAFRRGEFNRIVVVERLDDAPGGGQTATGWIADKFKAIFGRS
jgi:type VI secretion system (T6SS) effector TldE1-like protein